MTEQEYAALQKRVAESGRTQQSYIINAALTARISSAEEIATLKEISVTFGDLVKQLRGIAININQMARVANGSGALPTARELSQISEQIARYRERSEQIWQSIRSLITDQNHTVE
jgi:hypothetical protein